MNNSKLNNTASTIAKILSIILFVGAALCLLGMIVSWFGLSLFGTVIEDGLVSGNLQIPGVAMEITQVRDVEALRRIAAMSCLTAMLVCILNGMIFRNVYLIFETTKGKTKFSIGETPFQEANVRMIREIGLFAIAVPIAETVTTLISAVINHGSMSVTVNASSVFMGIVILCLSQVFAYGVTLQNEVDGLL